MLTHPPVVQQLQAAVLARALTDIQAAMLARLIGAIGLSWYYADDLDTPMISALFDDLAEA